MIINTTNRQRISIALMSVSSIVPDPTFAYAQSLTLTSPVLSPGSAIPPEFSCSGLDRSPALAWTGAPSATKTFVLLFDDPDAPAGTFIHWIAFNIPARVTSMPPDVPHTAQIPGRGRNGMNSFGHIGYNGPCPPPGKMHHYRIQLYALDSALTVADNPPADAIQSAMKGRVLATSELVGHSNVNGQR